MSRNRITARVQQIDNLEYTLGCRFATNISPTCRAQLIGYDDKLAYFKTLPNESWDKYNGCAGQEFWMPIQMVVCTQPMEWSCEI